jgi:hypothetical protein
MIVLFIEEFHGRCKSVSKSVSVIPIYENPGKNEYEVPEL